MSLLACSWCEHTRQELDCLSAHLLVGRLTQRIPNRMWVRAQSLQSCLTLCNPMDCSPQTPLSMGFSRQEYWSGLPFPTLRNLPNPGIKPGSLTSSALAGGFFTASATVNSSNTGHILYHHGWGKGCLADECGHTCRNLTPLLEMVTYWA